MDENQVPVETTEPPTKRTKLDEVENPVSSEAQPIAEAKKPDIVHENEDTKSKEVPAEVGSDSTCNNRGAGDFKQSDEKQDEAPKATEGTDVTQKATSVETVANTAASIVAQP